MKNSGIVRKVDELGRIVIPKEIRKTLGIRTGSSVEISVLEEGKLILQKFSDVGNIEEIAKDCLESIFSAFQTPLILTDGEIVVSCVGLNKKEFLGRKINEEYCCEKEKIFQDCLLVEGQCNRFEKVIKFPVSSSGFYCGDLFLCKKSDGVDIAEDVVAVCRVMAEYITRILNFE